MRGDGYVHVRYFSHYKGCLATVTIAIPCHIRASPLSGAKRVISIPWNEKSLLTGLVEGAYRGDGARN
jgi:hypothetical protein